LVGISALVSASTVLVDLLGAVSYTIYVEKAAAAHKCCCAGGRDSADDDSQRYKKTRCLIIVKIHKYEETKVA